LTVTAMLTILHRMSDLIPDLASFPRGNGSI
jgi:hypothetical protein